MSDGDWVLVLLICGAFVALALFFYVWIKAFGAVLGLLAGKPRRSMPKVTKPSALPLEEDEGGWSGWREDEIRGTGYLGAAVHGLDDDGEPVTLCVSMRTASHSRDRWDVDLHYQGRSLRGLSTLYLLADGERVSVYLSGRGRERSKSAYGLIHDPNTLRALLTAREQLGYAVIDERGYFPVEALCHLRRLGEFVYR